MAPVPPQPVTTTDEWLAAVHRELVGLRADLAATRTPAPPASRGPVLLEEPATPAPPAPRRKATGSKTRTRSGS